MHAFLPAVILLALALSLGRLTGASAAPATPFGEMAASVALR